MIANSTLFYEDTKALVDLIIKNTERENSNQTNFKKRKLSIPDNWALRSSATNPCQSSDLARTFNYAPVEKIFNYENAKTNELLRSMMEKSKSVHVSPYISKSIGSHIKSHNDRSKRTKEIFKELKNNIKTNNNITNNSSNLSNFNSGIKSKIFSAPARYNLSDIKEKLKISPNFIKSAGTISNSNSAILGFGIGNPLQGKIFEKEYINNTVNNNLIVNNNDKIITNLEENNKDFNFNNNKNNFNDFQDFVDMKNFTNFSFSNSEINNNINLNTPVFRQNNNNIFFNSTPEKKDAINNNSNEFNLVNSSDSFIVSDNSNLNEGFMLNKNLCFNFTDKEKDKKDNNNANTNN